MRSAATTQNNSGPHPLDATGSLAVPLSSYPTGWSFVLLDLRTCLDQESLMSVEAILGMHGVEEAFAARENLVNYKKLLLHMHEEGRRVTHELRRLVAFFREPLSGVAHDVAYDLDTAYGLVQRARGGLSPGVGFRRSGTHQELCDALGFASGAVDAFHDARRLGKETCCVPRDGTPPTAGVLRGLPGSTKTWTSVRRAHAFLCAEGRSAEDLFV